VRKLDDDGRAAQVRRVQTLLRVGCATYGIETPTPGELEAIAEGVRSMQAGPACDDCWASPCRCADPEAIRV
jgi:hypothetical protein